MPSHDDSILSVFPDAFQAIYARLEAQERRLEAQERTLEARDKKLDELRVNDSLADPHISQKNRSTTLTPNPDLLAQYPAVGETQFFEAALPKNHTVFTMADYHYNTNMEYQAPALHTLGGHLKLSAHAKAFDDTLALYQTKLAHLTRPLDTFAHELVQNPHDPHLRQRFFAFINTFRIMLGDIAGQMSHSRREVGLSAVSQISLAKGPSLLTLDDLTERRRQAEAILTASEPVVDPKTVEKKSQDKRRSRTQKNDFSKKSDNRKFRQGQQLQQERQKIQGQ
ncbi:hypothetical protein BGZ99_009017 [Dissophora globulifera]|uniref:Uncharacterized protein n=1 Tax=Dissophora globulifera TaxID=979702 RepID=A0A9P6UP54_9FUNG|nr:hypothetical protein BGZ99_009017 [Dissophora globulifera]